MLKPTITVLPAPDAQCPAVRIVNSSTSHQVQADAPLTARPTRGSLLSCRSSVEPQMLSGVGTAGRPASARTTATRLPRVFGAATNSTCTRSPLK
jgi:hypothetical protein